MSSFKQGYNSIMDMAQACGTTRAIANGKESIRDFQEATQNGFNYGDDYTQFFAGVRRATAVLAIEETEPFSRGYIEASLSLGDFVMEMIAQSALDC